MSTKVSIALTDVEDAELEAQARTTGKSKTALGGEHFRAGLSNGTSTIKAVQEVQAKLRLSNRELNAARRAVLDGTVEKTAGTATGPAWSPDQLDAAGLRVWWQALEDFVITCEAEYLLPIKEGWWIPGPLYRALGLGAAWWRDLELPGGSKAAKPRDEAEYQRWINEDLRTIAAAHTKAVNGWSKLSSAEKKLLRGRLDGVEVAGAFERFVAALVKERIDHPPEPVVKPDGTAELRVAAEARAEKRLEKEHAAYLAGARIPRPGTTYRPGVDPDTGEIEDPDQGGEEA